MRVLEASQGCLVSVPESRSHDGILSRGGQVENSV